MGTVNDQVMDICDMVVDLITGPGTLGSYQPLNWAWLAGVYKWRHMGLNITERNY